MRRTSLRGGDQAAYLLTLVPLLHAPRYSDYGPAMYHLCFVEVIERVRGHPLSLLRAADLVMSAILWFLRSYPNGICIHDSLSGSTIAHISLLRQGSSLDTEYV